MNKITHCCRCDKKLEESDDPVEFRIVPTLTSSVHATEVTRALFVTYPPRVRVDLQVELSNQKAGEAGEEFTLPIQVELLH